MSWSARLLEKLSAGQVYPLFLLESLSLGGAGRDQLRVSSFPITGYREGLTLQGSAISHGELRPATWDRSSTSLTLGLSVDPRRSTWRGQVVQLRIGFPGWRETDFEAVFVGQVRQVSYRAGLWSLQALDLVAGLTSRFDTPTLGGLFYEFYEDSAITSATTLTVALTTVGTPATVVSTADSFERETSGTYLALVEPVTGEDAFWIAASGKTATTLTSVSVGNVLDTTRVLAGIGSVVRGAAYVEDHPLEVARKVLVSTGAGTHGAHDTLPASWGYAIPSWLVDDEDIDRMIARTTPPTGGPEWVLHETEGQDDGLAYLSQWLAPGGFWLGTRQGLLTARGIVDLERERVDATITDDDIVSVEYDAWDPALPIEYYIVWVTSADNVTVPRELAEPHLETRPTVDLKRLHLPNVHANHVGWGDQIASRVGQLYTRIPERLTLRLRGWKHAGLTPGDVIRIRTRVVDSIYAGRGFSFADRRVLVVGGGPDWFGGSTTLRVLAAVPYDGAP